MKLSNLLVGIAMVMLLVSCKSEDEFTIAYKEFDAFFEFRGDQTFLIIPDIGCSGCIYKSMEFLEANLNTTNTYFIFTSINSRKDIHFKLNYLPDLPEKILFDYNNVFTSEVLIQSYPKIYHYSNGSMSYSEEINPENINVLDDFSLKYFGNKVSDN